MRIDAISGYQAVEVPLVVAGEPVATREVDLVRGRDLLLRVFVSVPRITQAPAEYRARLILAADRREPVVFEDVRKLISSSRKEKLESTFNFYVPGEEVDGEQTIAVEVWETGPCRAALEGRETRFPEEGGFALGARATGPSRVRIVPIRYDADGSGRMPDVSREHMEEMAAQLAAVFPVSHVELTMRSPVGTTEPDITAILNQLLQLRALEAPPSDVSYYGLVNPGPTMHQYCRFGCIAGVATFGPTSGAGAVGVGIGYRGAAKHTFVHEMGHVYRLMHAPCGGPRGTDPDFPHMRAAIGRWGYDARSGELIDPASDRRDFMSYCDPSWISDYHYQALLDRLSIVNGIPATDRFARRQETGGQALLAAAETALRSTPFSTAAAGESFRAEASPSAGADGALAVYRTLRVDQRGVLGWGVPVSTREEPGDLVAAVVLDEQGAELKNIDAYRLELSEDLGALYFVPQPEVGWHAVAVDGYEPYSFKAPDSVRPFVP